MTLPEWSSAFNDAVLQPTVALPLPAPTQDWAFGEATGAGVKVAVIDSGVSAEHERVGGLAGSVALEVDDDSPEGYRIVDGPHEDLYGHGTACAGIIRGLAPEADIYSVRVLGKNLTTRGALFAAAIRWCIDNGMQVANLSLSSRSEQWFGPLHALADEAYFRNLMLVCAANNVPGPTYPSQYASVFSVAAREGHDPFSLAYNPRPPVEFGAPGIDVDVAWTTGSITATGNSFAAPHIAGLVTLLLSKHPELTVFQVKSVLHALSSNAR
ncbi:S8 family serine peptidase [Naasia lichenicola]|uniref:Serine protease n=1 Tax=Naasia lichenicola TaxID=2565933 RepID=A0A4S4FK37_9MICO|nr:S8 family serine peptidase [Naasia lichenicola]THG30740.1 serine protease [Naasia lichenicola]THG31977.1 serine protease [Naasia lichenicola]